MAEIEESVSKMLGISKLLNQQKNLMGIGLSNRIEVGFSFKNPAFEQKKILLFERACKKMIKEYSRCFNHLLELVSHIFQSLVDQIPFAEIQSGQVQFDSRLVIRNVQLMTQEEFRESLYENYEKLNIVERCQIIFSLLKLPFPTHFSILLEKIALVNHQCYQRPYAIYIDAEQIKLFSFILADFRNTLR